PTARFLCRQTAQLRVDENGRLVVTSADIPGSHRLHGRILGEHTPRVKRGCLTPARPDAPPATPPGAAGTSHPPTAHRADPRTARASPRPARGTARAPDTGT